MATVFDYLKWRGDLSFSDVRVSEIDSVIFAMLTYIDFGELCGGEELLLREAAAEYEKLEILNNKAILDNIIYLGLKQRVYAVLKGSKNEKSL